MSHAGGCEAAACRSYQKHVVETASSRLSSKNNNGGEGGNSCITKGRKAHQHCRLPFAAYAVK
jgi:hypothetical protein